MVPDVMAALTENKIDLVDPDRLRELRDAALASPRGRAHLLLHADHQDQVQRLLIAVEPQTYVRAHKHSEQWEMLVLLSGKVDVLLLDDDARLQRRVTLQATLPVIQIPVRQCHCAVSLETGSIVMEVKPGPFRPNEFMAWAPEEGSADAGAFLTWARIAASGQTWAGAGNKA